MKTPASSVSTHPAVAVLGSAARAHAPAAHGRPNEGGLAGDTPGRVGEAESPRQVIRGESFSTPHPKNEIHPFAALTDWLNLTFPFDGSSESLAGIVRGVAENLGPKFGSMRDRNKGLRGFKHSFEFDHGGVMFAYGGQRGKGYLSFPGEGCALIPDWQAAYRYFKDDLKARITRWDGAVDDYHGRYTVDTAMAWYLAGCFGTHGNQPKMKQAGNWAQPDGSGRTIYIGQRKNGKTLRVYEKGKQLGSPESLWTRWELELHNRDREVPLEVLLSPGPYVADSYKCLGWISEEVCRIRTIKKEGQISYDHLTACLRNAYGRHLNVMQQIEGSHEAVMQKLVLPGVPKRLRLPDIDLPPQDVPE